MATIANLTVALNADVGGFTGTLASATRSINQFRKMGQSVFESTRTPLEQYEAGLKRLKALYHGAAIDADTYSRAISKLNDEYHGTSAKQEQLRAAGVKVFREMMTPLEQYRAKVADLNRLLATGAINQATYGRAKASAVTQLSNTGARGDMNRAATAVFNSTRTAAERYAQELAKLDRLARAGAISQDTYGRALRKLQNDFTVLAKVVPEKSSGIGSQLAGGLLGFSTGVGATIVAAHAAMNAVKGLSDSIVSAGADALRLAADFERAEISFTTLFKSASVAKQVMAEVKQFAAATPFEFPELKDAAVKLAGFGIAAKELVPTLKVLGDISAGTGASVNELAETYGKARIQGRAYTRDVNEFANRGVPIWEALNRVMKTNSAETHKLVEDGKVGFRELQEAIISLTEAGGMFEGGLEAQSKSLYGLASTIRDNLNLALAELGEQATSELGIKSLAQDAIELTQVLKTDGVPVLLEFGKGLMILATAANDAITATTGIDASISGLTETIYGAHASILQWRLAMAQTLGTAEQVAKIQAEILALGMRATGAGGAGAGSRAPSLEAGGNKTGIEEEIAALERQAEMIGKSSQEKKLAELATKGLLEADMEYAAELIRQVEEQTAAMAAEEQTRKTMESHIAALKQQADTWGYTAKQMDLYKQSLAGATAEELKAIAVQQDRIEELKKYDEEQKKDADNHKNALSEIGRITERNLTPLEKFNRDMAHLKELKRHGLSDEQFGRESERLKKELEESGKKRAGEHRNTATAALVAGSSEFYSALSKSIPANKKNGESKDRKEALKIQRREELHLRNLDNASKKKKVFTFTS